MVKYLLVGLIGLKRTVSSAGLAGWLPGFVFPLLPGKLCRLRRSRRYGFKKTAAFFSPDDRDRRFLELQLFADGEDKTEEPTPHRQREARKRGQVMKSMEVNAAVNMLGMVLLYAVSWHFLLNGFTSTMVHYLRLPGTEVDLPAFAYLARFSLERYLALAAPFLLTALFLGVFSNLMQVGFLVSGEALKPQLNRLNPLEGVKRIFSARALFELVKSLLKITIIGVVSYFYLRSQFPAMLQLLGQDSGVFTVFLKNVLLGLALRVAAVFFFLALLDFLYQRYEFRKSLRMTRREVKEEYRQLEGDPHVRSRLRERQRAILRQRGLASVPEATVVITNPTELAVALRYREKIDGAPVVVAKGAARLAERIREIAAENNIPIIQDPPVARLLFYQVEVGEEIPVELYQAVAEILALVYRLQEKEQKRRQQRSAGT